MNERLAELESQVKKLYEKLGMSEEPEFESGEWVGADKNYSGLKVKFLGKIQKIEKDRYYYTGFDACGNWKDNDFYLFNDISPTKETPKSVETALRKEWARRTKEKGWENPDEAEIEAHAGKERYILDVNSGAFTSLYNQRDDRLYTKNGIIYHDGNWATPKEKKSEVNPIVVNGYEAEFYEGYVQFGCAKIENSIFEELQEFIDAERPDVAGTIGNKAVTGFRIGEGLFDIETIKAITERING